MPHLPAICIATCIALLLPQISRATKRPLHQQPTAQLEQRRQEIQNELAHLAPLSLRTGSGAIGFRSQVHATPDADEWIQIDLEAPGPIDQIILVPTISRSSNQGFRSDGFPITFQLLAGVAPDTNGTVIAAFSEKDHLLPRIAPLIIHCPGTTASWIRLEASQLSTRSWDDQFIFQLAEIMAFNQSQNRALRHPVTTSSNRIRPHSPWQPQHIVNGFVPYLMDASAGPKSRAYVSPVSAAEQPAITIDLESPLPIDCIQLHTIELSDTIPAPTTIDFGMPRRMKIEAANQPDFSDAILLFEHTVHDLYDLSPILTWPIPETVCRYIRLTATAPYIFNGAGLYGSRIGFAEIELFSHGENVALHKPVLLNFPDHDELKANALTDGRNLYGNILPIRQWLNELAKRHDLERELPPITQELIQRYQRQKTHVRTLLWLTAFLSISIGFILFIGRLLRQRKETRMKERFAADLHDEIGANIHSIGLMSDLATRSINAPEKLQTYHQRIRAMTQRTGDAIRHCTNLLEAETLFTELKEDMQRTAERILTTQQHTLTIEGESYLAHLPPRTTIDLVLFYKESLININRHADATRIATQLTATAHHLHLEICDNGCGINPTAANAMPPSLKRRARLLKAQVTLKSAPQKGTTIHLHLTLKTPHLKHPND